MNLLTFLSINNIKTFIRFAFPILASFLITRYSINRPRKLAIKEKQLFDVYLPLYKSIFTVSSSVFSPKQLTEYDTILQEILHKHYVLVSPELHNLYSQFHHSLKTEEIDSTKTWELICYQIKIEYELLKSDLGYPSENIFSTFLRMTLKDKLSFVCIKTFIPLLILWILSEILHWLPYPILNSISAISSPLAFISCVLSLILGIISSSMRR